MARQPLGGLGRLIFRGFTITHLLDTPHPVGLLWTRDQLVAETSTWQHSKETDIHALGGIQTHNPSTRAAVDPRLRPRGHWDRHTYRLPLTKYCIQLYHIQIRHTHTHTHTHTHKEQTLYCSFRALSITNSQQNAQCCVFCWFGCCELKSNNFALICCYCNARPVLSLPCLFVSCGF
jgi:hypothetical protein